MALGQLPYECLGGPLHGETVQLPPHATEYLAVRSGGRGLDRYRVEEVVGRTADGRETWRRRCLVWVEGQE